MTAAQILESIRRLAHEAGRVPGERTFLAATGLSRTDLWNAGFPSFGAAVSATGLSPNTLNQALDDDLMLEHLARLTDGLGHFPRKGDVKVARRADPQMPSYEAYFRLSGGSYPLLRARLLDWCEAKDVFPAVREMLRSQAPGRSPDDARPPAKSQRLQGYVYLVKHDRDYKIGRSNDITRRRRELAIILPSELEHIHIIETDDPEGIEQYWHRRFEARRTRGEWFRLLPDDVAAFKRRRYQ